MSRVNKNKHVMREMLADDFEHPTENQKIARIISSRGNNLHVVEAAAAATSEAITGDSTVEELTFLVSMPVKFRKNVWIKRGDFVVIEPIEEGDKVKAEIVRILTPQHIKEFTKDGIWPAKFTKNKDIDAINIDRQDGDETDEDDDLVRNTNRRQVIEESDSDDDDDDEDDNSDED